MSKGECSSQNTCVGTVLCCYCRVSGQPPNQECDEDWCVGGGGDYEPEGGGNRVMSLSSLPPAFSHVPDQDKKNRALATPGMPITADWESEDLAALGLQVGDVITRLDNVSLAPPKDIWFNFWHQEGSHTITIRRNGQAFTVPFTMKKKI